MSITNYVARLLPGFGSPAIALVANGVTLTATGTITVPIPNNYANVAVAPSGTTVTNNGGYIQSTSNGPFLNSGYIYVRVYGVTGTSPTLTIEVQLTNGTTTSVVLPTSGTISGEADITIPYNSQLGAVAASVICTIGGTSPSFTFDIEVTAGGQ